jgi:hypothetical protein
VDTIQNITDGTRKSESRHFSTKSLDAQQFSTAYGTVDEAKVEIRKFCANIDGASKVRHQMWVHYVMFNFSSNFGNPVRLR